MVFSWFVKYQKKRTKSYIYTVSDSRREDAMEESSNMESKARDILISSSHEELSTIVSHLFMRQETEEYKSAKAMYDFFVANFVNPLASGLLTVYKCSSNGVVRFRSIYLLSDTLTRLRNRNFTLSPVTLYKIKPLLISCLTMEVTKESDIKIFGRIVSFVAYNVVMLENDGWNELRDCILSLADKEPLKAFHVFVGLPVVTEKTIIEQVLEKVLDEATKFLLNLEQDRAEHWSLAVETFVKTGIHLSDSGKRQNLMELVLKSSKNMVEKGREQFIERGLEDLKKFLARDSYSKVQLIFVGNLALQISGACCKTLEHCKKIATEILQTVENPEKNSKDDHGSGFERDWYDYLKNLSSLELFGIFASTDLEDMSRELAIRRLNILLSQIKEHVPSDHISVMIQLQPLVISCLEEDGLSDSMVKVLGEVVDHVICQMIIWEDKIWEGDGLSDFIVSQSKSRFQRVVYIFQCFTMRLEDDRFLISVMDNLLPEISSRLNPPSESLSNNSSWVLAFAGAFCAIIHMIEFPSYKESLKEIAYKMIDSVREFVERGMEVGIVRRAFRDVESIVKKQLEWYDTSEYKFVKGLLWRLYAIKGMKWESKIVLWRINVILESGVAKKKKELPKSELDSHDWINQSENKESNEELDEDE